MRDVRSILAALLLAATLRLVWLGSIPPGINQDEAVHAFEAKCLHTLGADHDGTPWPIFFRCFGEADHHSAPFIYLLVPLQLLFGMGVWTTRLPSAILGVLTVFLLYATTRRAYGSRIAFWASLFLAVEPWHVQLSRLGLEVSICPFLVLLGVYLAQSSRRPIGDHFSAPIVTSSLSRLFASGVVFGLATWTYNAMRLFVPLLLLGTATIVSGTKILPDLRKVNLRKPAAFLLGLLFGLAPFLWATVRTPEKAWSRALDNVLWNRDAGFADMAVTFAGTYAKHFSPSFLFSKGDGTIIHSLPGLGQIPYFFLLLVPLGLCRIIRRFRDDPIARWLLWLLLIAPLPAAFSDLEGPHALRSAGAIPVYALIAALGLDFLFFITRSLGKFVHRLTLGLSVLAFMLYTAYFAYFYAVLYPTKAARVFQAEWRDAFREVEALKDEYDLVMLTQTQANQLGMLYLFWNNVDPREYVTMPKKVHCGDKWDYLIQYDKIVFLSSESLSKSVAAGIHRLQLLHAERPEFPGRGRVIKEFHHPDGSAALILYDTTVDLSPH